MDGTLAKQFQDFARLSGGFRASRVLLTANNLQIFEHIGKGTTAAELAKGLTTDLRATEILLDAITALGLLRKTKGLYRLTAPAKRFLLPDSPWYQGDMLRHMDTLWKNWSGLDEAVRTGMPYRSGGRRHDVFIRAMHNNAVLRTPSVLKAIDLRGVKRALDLGCGPGTYGVALAKLGIEVTLFDLPNSVGIAHEMIRQAGLTNVTFRGGDFHFDDIGDGYDLVLLSQVLHSHSPLENIALLGKVHTSLSPKGQIAVHEFTLAEDHASPVPGALFSVNMLVNTAEGRSYTPKEMSGWLTEAGFGRIRKVGLGETVVITARKSRDGRG